MNKIIQGLLLTSCLLAPLVQAEKVIRLQGFSIEGGAEEPNVLYVTPWSPPPGTGRLFAPMKSYREHWFKSVNRNVLKREVAYAKRNKRKAD